MIVRTDAKSTKEKVNDIIKACAEEIAENGAEALCGDDQYITEGRIVITINDTTAPTIEYERTTICKKALGKW